MDSNATITYEYPNIGKGYRPYFQMLGVMITINFLVILAWIIYFARQLVTYVRKIYFISKLVPSTEEIDKQYKFKVEFLKRAYVIGCFLSLLLCQGFGMAAYVVIHKHMRKHEAPPYFLSQNCSLKPVGWLFQLYTLPKRFLVYQAIWYACTLLSLTLFMWLLNMLVKAYRKSLNQIKYFPRVIFTAIIVGITFILSVVLQTAVFGSLLFSVLVLVLYVAILRNARRFDLVLNEIKKESQSYVERDDYYAVKLGQDEEAIKRYRIFISSILILFGFKLLGQVVYTFTHVFLFSILINPCWFTHVYKIPFHFELPSHTIDGLVQSSEYLIIFHDVMACLYLYGFFLFSVAIVFLPKLYLLMKNMCKHRRTKDEGLKTPLIINN